MIILIPKWRNSIEDCSYDSIVNLSKMYLKESNIDFEILSLNYIPDLRYLLHEYGLYEATNWNIFDSIQNINISSGSAVMFNDLSWPEDAEVIYQPTNVLVNRHDEVYANVIFSKYGFVSKVIFFDEGVVTRVDYYDDRGFLSKSKVKIGETKDICEYFNENGDMIFKEINGRVFICTDYYHLFRDKEYATLKDVIVEKYEEYILSHFSFTDKCLVDFCEDTKIAIQDKVIQTTCLFSDEKSVQEYSSSGLNVKSIIFINEFLLRTFNTDVVSNFNCKIKKHVISPYCTTLSLGKSSELANNNIYIYAKDSNYSAILTLVTQLFNVVKKDHYDRFLINLPDSNSINKMHDYIKQKTKEFFQVDTNTLNFKFAVKYISDKANEVLFVNQEKRKKELEKSGVWESLEKTANFLNQFKLFSYTDKFKFEDDFTISRVYVDLGAVPNQYLQTLAISFGIPQIVAKENQFVVPNKNGIVVSNGIVNAIMHFVNDLDNWNISLVVSAQLIEQYAQGRLIHSWNEAIYEKN